MVLKAVYLTRAKTCLSLPWGKDFQKEQNQTDFVIPKVFPTGKNGFYRSVCATGIALYIWDRDEDY